MASYCPRCGRESELYAAPDGGMYCQDCARQLSSPACTQCVKCFQRRCGDAVYACPFCHGSPDTLDVEAFQRQLKKERVLQTNRVDESCERCGGSLHGKAFILNGKALCKKCLLYEQDKWEIVTGKPGKSGTRVKIVVEKPKAPEPPEKLREDRLGKKLISLIGVDIKNPPPDPFSDSGPMDERRMPDDSCVNCEAYSMGKMGKKILGVQSRKREK